MFPTPVGMNRILNVTAPMTMDVPHACGDEPVDDIFTRSGYECSPRLWG